MDVTLEQSILMDLLKVVIELVLQGVDVSILNPKLT